MCVFQESLEQAAESKVDRGQGMPGEGVESTEKPLGKAGKKSKGGGGSKASKESSKVKEERLAAVDSWLRAIVEGASPPDSAIDLSPPTQ